MKLSLISIFFLMVHFVSANLAQAGLTYSEVREEIELNVSYPLIMEGYEIPGLVNRTGQFFCGSIVFLHPDYKGGIKSDDNILYYVFKAWGAVNGKCDYTNTDDVNLLTKGTCPAGVYRNKRQFSVQEIRDTRVGARGLEMISQGTDGLLKVRSTCYGELGNPGYVLQAGGGTTDRSLGYMEITDSFFESKTYSVLKDDVTAQEVMTFQINNGWKYVVLLNEKAE